MGIGRTNAIARIGTADAILGVIDSQKRFQPLSFSGTTPSNSGDPEIVENYKSWNSTIPSSDPSTQPSQSANFYKCSSIDTINHTWTGYLASVDSVTGIWSFAETATSGLTYDRLTPIIGYVYDSNCTFLVSRYNEGFVYLRNLPFLTGYTDEVIQDSPKASGGNHSISDGALTFPSTGANYIRYNALSQQPDVFSIIFWIKYGNDNQENNTPIMFGNNLNESETSFFRFLSDGRIKFGAQTTVGTAYSYDSSEIDRTSWTLVSISFSGSEYKIYLNTTLVATISTTTPIIFTRDLWFGSFYGYNDEHTFKGSIRRFRILDSIIDAEQAHQIYTSEMPTD